MLYATEFSEISQSVNNNDNLKSRVLELIKDEPIPGKVTEGEVRLENLKDILTRYFNGTIGIPQAITDVECRLPRHGSPYKNNNRVFPQGWSERLVRTSISRFYNQAVLTEIVESGGAECFIGHSSSESAGSNCSQLLAGSRQSASDMLDRLTNAYRDGNWSKEVKIPSHPHCTHTVQPV
ncbi:hypothetical protein [Chromohalobacter nigrandesensis]|uniref:hypothetical protein n=1 Tax=Chromohalobacter nigrandesensis TaxID=119863 RepID=UPI001FF18DF3|nr:hypothetical protein [Chromohalobacter nigrandesensis]MCK0746349.1 hypothetical protein [Chromohalobacter nigrandesensis]